jgi:hypothetical protein
MHPERLCLQIKGLESKLFVLLSLHLLQNQLRYFHLLHRMDVSKRHRTQKYEALGCHIVNLQLIHQSVQV